MKRSVRQDKIDNSLLIKGVLIGILKKIQFYFDFFLLKKVH